MKPYPSPINRAARPDARASSQPQRHPDDDFEVYRSLMAPFQEDELVVHTSRDGGYCTPKETAIADRFDQVLGTQHWCETTTTTETSVVSVITVTYPSGKRVTRSGTYFFPVRRDKAGIPFFDRRKGGARAFIRAAKRIGPGRYLDHGRVYAFAPECLQLHG